MASNPGLHGTFAQWRDWANAKSPGAGDQFITWVQANAKVPPPYAFNINSDAYGPTGFGQNNWAEDYFAGWLLLANVGPDIAKALAGGITAGSRAVPKFLTGTARGIGQVPGAKTLSGLAAIGNFFNELGQANTWIRFAQVLLGLGLIIVGLAKLASGTAAGKAAIRAGKAAAIL